MLNAKKIKAELPETIRAHILNRLDEITRNGNSLILSEDQLCDIDRLVNLHEITFTTNVIEDPRYMDTPEYVIHHILALDAKYRVLLKKKPEQEKIAIAARLLDEMAENENIVLTPADKTETDIYCAA